MPLAGAQRRKTGWDIRDRWDVWNKAKMREFPNVPQKSHEEFGSQFGNKSAGLVTQSLSHSVT